MSKYISFSLCPDLVPSWEFVKASRGYTLDSLPLAYGSKLQLDTISFFDVILSCVLVCGFLSTLVYQTNKSILHTYFITPTLHRLTWKELNGHLNKRNFLLPFNSFHVNGVKWVWSVTLFLPKTLRSFAEHRLKVVAVFPKWNEEYLLPLTWCFWEWILLLYIFSWTVVATLFSFSFFCGTSYYMQDSIC